MAALSMMPLAWSAALAPGGAGPTATLIPAYLLEVPSSVISVLVADTATATMYRFARSTSGNFARDQRYMSIGQSGVGKQRAWDRKTPLGVYFITERLDTSRMHEKYGVAAYPLDYPNAWDRMNARTGDGIWLHGVDRRNPDRPALDTDGCLALPNEELLLLEEELEPRVTPIIVAREMRWADASTIEVRREEFRAALDDWRGSLEDGDLVSYLALYADEFHYRSMDRATWAAWRYDVFRARPLAEVELQDVMLLEDPEEPSLYISRFSQVLTTTEGPVTTMKRLYWRREGDRWQIIAEDNG